MNRTWSFRFFLSIKFFFILISRILEAHSGYVLCLQILVTLSFFFQLFPNIMSSNFFLILLTLNLNQNSINIKFDWTDVIGQCH